MHQREMWSTTNSSIKPITGDTYMRQLDCLRDAFQEKRQVLVNQHECILYVRVHVTLRTNRNLETFGVLIPHHQPYSLDTFIYSFRSFCNCIAGKTLRNDNDVKRSGWLLRFMPTSDSAKGSIYLVLNDVRTKDLLTQNHDSMWLRKSNNYESDSLVLTHVI